MSKALVLDPSLMDKYFAAAEMVAARAVRSSAEGSGIDLGAAGGP